MCMFYLDFFCVQCMILNREITSVKQRKECPNKLEPLIKVEQIYILNAPLYHLSPHLNSPLQQHFCLFFL